LYAFLSVSVIHHKYDAKLCVTAYSSCSAFTPEGTGSCIRRVRNNSFRGAAALLKSSQRPKMLSLSLPMLLVSRRCLWARHLATKPPEGVQNDTLQPRPPASHSSLLFHGCRKPRQRLSCWGKFSTCEHTTTDYTLCIWTQRAPARGEPKPLHPRNPSPNCVMPYL